MQSFYAEHFERDVGCTSAEWRRLLTGALATFDWQDLGDAVQVTVGTGHLRIRWAPLAPRVIALMRVPRLQVCFDFEGLSADQRLSFMKRLDLYTHRGGG